MVSPALMFVHEGVDGVGVCDFLAVDGDDEVAAQHDGRVNPNTPAGCRRAGRHVPLHPPNHLLNENA